MTLFIICLLCKDERPLCHCRHHRCPRPTNGLPQRWRPWWWRKPGPCLLFDCDSKGRYPRAVRTLIPVGTCRPNGPAVELLVPESRPAGDLHLRPRPHTEPVKNRVVPTNRVYAKSSASFVSETRSNGVRIHDYIDIIIVWYYLWWKQNHTIRLQIIRWCSSYYILIVILACNIIIFNDMYCGHLCYRSKAEKLGMGFPGFVWVVPCHWI